jgi:hypothetical protein
MDNRPLICYSSRTWANGRRHSSTRRWRCRRRQEYAYVGTPPVVTLDAWRGGVDVLVELPLGLAEPRSPSRRQGSVGGGEAILKSQWVGDVALSCLFIYN